MLTLTRMPLDEVDWPRVDAYPDRVLFQTRPWLSYLERSLAVEPVVAVLRDGGDELGWFTGAIQRRLGIRVLGAPMPGMTTQYLGWNLRPGVSRRAAFSTLMPFAFHSLRCAHVEVCDRWASFEDLSPHPFHVEGVRTFLVDLTGGDSAVAARMAPGVRQNMRKASREGVVVEDADPDGFAADYYAQLTDVFAKQGLVPTYPRRRVEQLIEALHPTGRLQLLRARSADGQSLATALVVGYASTAYFWGGASWRQHQHLRPNEPLLWHAFTTWAHRGVTSFDFGGGGEYKRRYGAHELVVPSARLSRSPVLELLRSGAKRAVSARQAGRFAASTRIRTAAAR